MKSFNAFLTEQVIVNVIINFAIAYYLSSATLSALSHIPLLAPSDHLLMPNISGDLFVGTFLMGLIITLITAPITRAKRKKSSHNLGQFVAPTFIKKLPESLFMRGVVIGIVPAVVIALPIVMILTALDINQLQSSDYIIYHALYAATMAGFISYATVSRNLAENPAAITFNTSH